jgi:hypothetical protein
MQDKSHITASGLAVKTETKIEWTERQIGQETKLRCTTEVMEQITYKALSHDSEK